ncbi:hypothetical protein KAU43_08265 [candidate division WOR-3 bacterium]|jgi:hypothetical protein|nr:hypothetical protein [candidate division WOR-3 bacterium]
MKLRWIIVIPIVLLIFAGCNIETPEHFPVFSSQINIPIGDSTMTVEKAIEVYTDKSGNEAIYIENDTIYWQSDTAYTTDFASRDSLIFYLGITKDLPGKIDTIKTVFNSELSSFKGIVHLKGNNPGPDTFIGTVNYTLTAYTGDTTLYDSMDINLPLGDFDTTLTKVFTNFNLGGYKLVIEGFDVTGVVSFDTVWGYTKLGFLGYINGDTLYTIEIPFGISDDLRNSINPDSMENKGIKLNFINIASLIWNNIPIGADYDFYLMNHTKTDTFYLTGEIIPPQIDANGFVLSDTLSELDIILDSTLLNVLDTDTAYYLVRASTPNIGKIFVKPTDYLRFQGHITADFWINLNEVTSDSDE